MSNDFKMRGDQGDVIIGSRAEFWIVYVPLCVLAAGAPLFLAGRTIWMLMDPATTAEEWDTFLTILSKIAFPWMGITLWLTRLWWRRKHGSAARRGSASSSAMESAR